MNFWLRHHVVTGVIGAFAWGCMTFIPVYWQVASADEVVQEAAKGRDTGANFLLNYALPGINDSPPPSDTADYFNPDGTLKNEVWSQELFPGYNPSDPAQHDSLKALKDNPNNLTTQGVGAQISLGSGSDETSLGYQALQDATANPHHAVTDMAAETFLDVSREILSGESPFLDEILMSCEEQIAAGSRTDKSSHVEEIYTCDQVPVAPPSSCSVDRDFTLEAVETKTILTVSAGGGNPTGIEHWEEFGLPGPTPSTAGLCQVVWDEFEPWPAVLPYSRMIEIMWNYGGWPEPRYMYTWVYGGAYCGTHVGKTPAQIQSDCTASADYVERTCRNFMPEPEHSFFWLGGPQGMCATQDGVAPYDYSSCPAGRDLHCQTMASDHYADCMGMTAGTPMNGATTLTASALLPAANQTGVALLGTTVDITEDPFDLAAHGLGPGEYVIAAHVVSGTGVTSHTIVDGGSYASNWDYTFDVSVTDADSFTVEATLYRVASNGFVYNGCGSSDVDNVLNGNCVGSIECTDLVDPCRDVNGVQICTAPGPTDGVKELMTSWNSVAPAIDPMCWSASVGVTECVVAYDCIASGGCTPSCDDLPPELQAECLGPPCWTDANGEETCLDSTSEHWANNLGEPGYVDDCAEYLIDPACVLLPDRPCVEGMEDPNDPTICLMREVQFDCGYDVTIPDTTVADSSEVTCAGEFRCFGDECSGTATESNPDYGKAAAASTMITEASKDISCAVEGDPSSCTLFDSDVSQCRALQGSWLGLLPDCCKDAMKGAKAAGTFSEYMQLAKLTYQLAQKPMVASWLASSYAGTAINAAIGPGSAVQQSVMMARGAIANGFSSAMQWMGFSPTTAANVGSTIAGSTATAGFGVVQQFIAQGVYDFLGDIGMSTLADSLFATTAEGLVTDWAASGLGQMIGSIISIIGWIYMIYQIVKIIAMLIFKCKDKELEFGVQLRNRMCHYVGRYCSKRVWVGLSKKCLYKTKSYCCFASPLSRILMEQIKGQGIGGDWGTAKKPVCDGLAISDLELVDWSLVDLSEWEAILFEAGLVPDPRNPPTNFVPTETHDGVATGGSEGVDSVTLNLEAINVVKQKMDDGRFLLEAEPVTTGDPDLMPWYGNP